MSFSMRSSMRDKYARCWERSCHSAKRVRRLVKTRPTRRAGAKRVAAGAGRQSEWVVMVQAPISIIRKVENAGAAFYPDVASAFEIRSTERFHKRCFDS